MSEKTPKYGVPTVDQLVAFDDTKTDYVDVDEWKMSLKIRSLSKADELRLRKEASSRGELDEQKLEGLMLVTGILEPKFEKYHIQELQKKSQGAINKVLLAIMQLSGLAGVTEDSDPAEEAEEDFRDES